MDEITNRSAILVTAREPFIKWATFYNDISIEELNNRVNEKHIYLIKWSYQEDLKKVLESYYAQIFEFELSDWNYLEDEWPENRTCELFLEWFCVELFDDLFDLETEKIIIKDAHSL